MQSEGCECLKQYEGKSLHMNTQEVMDLDQDHGQISISLHVSAANKHLLR